MCDSDDKPMRPSGKDIRRLSNAGSNHDCGSLSRVVMVRKTDQRVINHKNPKESQTEVITMETIQTYKGHKPDRTVVIKKRDLSANAVLTTSTLSERDHGYSSLTPSRTFKTDISKDLSSMSLLTPDEPSYNSNPNSPNNNTRKTILNGGGTVNMSRDANNNPYGTPTMYTKHNRNAINSRIQQQHDNNNSISFSKSPMSIRNSPSLRSSPGVRYSTPSPVNRRSVYTDFELDCLRAHNEFRARHGVPPLKLNKRLCKHAEEWARILASRGVLLHRNNSAYGENIFCSWSSNNNNNHVTGREPVEHWYSEIGNHVFHKEPTTLKTGHFTQVVWKESRELGVGMAKNRTGEVFVVANYDPPGNYIGSFERNVHSLIDESKARDSMEKSSDDGEEEKPSPEEFEAFAQRIMKHHNELRKKHHAPEMKLTKELMNDAQYWAEQLAQNDKLSYRQNSDYGENLYCLWSSDREMFPNAKEVCKSWYDEVKAYDFTAEPKRSLFKGGQFSQMIWKSSKELGVGLGRTKSGKSIVVCTYYPRGNVFGQFMLNVKKAN